MTVADAGLMMTIVLIGLLTGNELGTLIIHSTLDGLSFDESRPAAQAIVTRMGRLMPIAMPLTLLVTFASAIACTGNASALLTIAGVALVVMLVITFVGLMPLNSRELGATAGTAEADWRGWRKRWLHLHSFRVVCDLTALVLVAIAAVLT
ncbi:MAG: DUF1772 domain-containing protein [Thermomicrobiales bacterium]